MRILGIETSCDETAAAVYEGNTNGGHILAERISSQINIHARFGGIVPEIASRQHLLALPPMVHAVMDEAQLGWTELHGIAVTAGPGLLGALLVGVSYARAAGTVNAIPVMPIHHLEGHLLAPGLESGLPPFPFITLLVSGGHTMLTRVDDIGRYTLLGQTVDDAAGECFDKSARLLELPYPGGPAIAKLAEDGDAASIPLPRPMLDRDDLNFSFSGLKTAVMHAIHRTPENRRTESFRRNIAAALQEAVLDVLVQKGLRACLRDNIGDLIVAGGVAANQRLRDRLTSETTTHGIAVHLPHPRHCTDNAAMIAYTGFRRNQAGLKSPKSWDGSARWPLGNL